MINTKMGVLKEEIACNEVDPLNGYKISFFWPTQSESKRADVL